MRNVGIGEHHHVDRVVLDQALEILPLENRNPIRIQASSKDGRVTPSADVWDLGGSESNNLVVEVLAEENIEIVEVSARSSKSKNGFHDGPHRAELLCIFAFLWSFLQSRQSRAGVILDRARRRPIGAQGGPFSALWLWRHGQDAGLSTEFMAETR